MPVLFALALYLGIHVYFLGIVTTLIVYMPWFLEGHLTYTEQLKICIIWPRLIYKEFMKKDG